MASNFAKALDTTHSYLHNMGAKIAPSKSFNFATHRKVKQWLGEKTWENICSKVDVVDDLRYLGAQVTTTYDVISGTLETRLDKSHATA